MSRQSRSKKQSQDFPDLSVVPSRGFVQTPRSERSIEAKTENQKKYLAAMKTFTLTFGVGPAGTGKSFLATVTAANMLLNHGVEKIILTRPAVEAGESLGFLPGEIEDKFDPYLEPFKDALSQYLGRGYMELLIKRGTIVAKPLAYLRGCTFRNSFVILDEAQNTTPAQMKMFLTRIGENAKVVVNGDPDQRDIRGQSGLIDAVNRLSSLNDSRIVEFGVEDIVRSDMVGQIIRAYSS